MCSTIRHLFENVSIKFTRLQIQYFNLTTIIDFVSPLNDVGNLELNLTIYTKF